MYKIKFAFVAAAAAALFASCSKEVSLPYNDSQLDTYGTATASFRVNIPVERLATRASHNGGATNVDTAQYDLRYIVEAWTQDPAPKLAFRDYRIVATDFTTQGITLDASLSNGIYDFVFWADFVNNGTTEATAHDADLFYTTNDGSSKADIIADPTVDEGLQNILLKQPSPAYDINDDARDAFFQKVTIDLTAGDVTKAVTLYRPFGKYRLIATDNGGYTTALSTMTLQYNTATLPAGFNALTGAVNTGTTVSVSGTLYTKNIVTEDVIVKGTTYKKAGVLAFDYVFAPAAQVVNMTVKAYNAANTQIGDTRTLTNIPIAQNRLTTVIGNFFLPNAHLNIIVHDPFDEEDEVNYDGDNIDDYININHLVSYPTVNAALDAALSGDSVFIPSGEYPAANVGMVPINVVVKGHGSGFTTIKTDNGLRVAGVLDGVNIMPATSRNPGEPWASNVIGIELLADGELKNSAVNGFMTGIFADSSTGVEITGSVISGNYYGIQFTGGVSATVKDTEISLNEAYGVGFLYKSGAIATNIPTFENTTISDNWATQVFNAWADAYVVNLDGNGNQIGGVSEDKTLVHSDSVYSRDVTGTVSGSFDANYYIATVIANNQGNVGLTAELIGTDFGRTIWAVRNADEDNEFVGSPEHSGKLFQWNSYIAYEVAGVIGSWDSSWEGGFGTPGIFDTWQDAQNPCPEGWRVPTKDEATTLLSIGIGATVSFNSVDCYKRTNNDHILYFPKTQYRNASGTVVSGDSFYWTNASGDPDDTAAVAFNSALTDKDRAFGLSVRCVKVTR
ncbi:MAG: hypothetical protein LBR06_09250 [Bacteroidales bacterium]|jgi:uncharacterized protein (TIGR02145 family)|nr:hypothetical protein [Bacteroidales bacterium]